jgi:tRNA pseudouridine38-40 synthase
VIARVGPGEHRLRLTLHYDGGAFAGWQVQAAARTVQGELEAALRRLTTVRVRVVAAGRTDAGVHATGQVVGLAVPVPWGADRLRQALNAVLPVDMWVAAATVVDDAFHARYDAVARGYAYRVGTADVARSPFLRRWCWPLGEALSLSSLNDAAGRFVGVHSFRAFAKTGQPQRGERCVVHIAQWRDWAPGGVLFHVVANRFLHHMVRYMVGTMVDVARGRRQPADVDDLLAGGSGLVTSRPAPARGLYLTRVYYDADTWTGEDATDEVLS